ncbi:MAG: DUF998 domain-containing protein [Nocardiopsaceae bacterium]|jgi:hypothetical protein|nr:DUF998 domain-containing protein [Nocardiopsaceae bacterium]
MSIDSAGPANVRVTPTQPAQCSPEQRLTRSLLGYGAAAGPFYIVISLAQAVAHDGFDLTRHDWSLLATGPAGWIQIANLVLTGAMTLAFAVGLARSTSTRWAPRLVATYGVGLMLAGILVADPTSGYPVGAATPDAPSWHGLGHVIAGGLGFLAVIVAAFALARTFAREGDTAFAWWSRLTGAFYLAAFAGIASGSTGPAIVLTFTAAVVALWTWIAAIAVRQSRALGSAR